MLSRLYLFPLTAEVNRQGHLIIGGCNTVEMTSEFGTPLYVFDEFTLRRKCREFKSEFGQRYADTTVIYACKAVFNRALALIFRDERLGLDLVSSGELGIAQSIGFPVEQLYFHGNNKSVEEIGQALDGQVGRIVVDNFHELTMLNEIAAARRKADILLRLSPGVDPHTHQYMTTGVVDSKFGFPWLDGEKAVAQALAAPNLSLIGFHFHLGSLIFSVEPYLAAIELTLDFAAKIKHKYGFELKELNVGGGFAIQYSLDCPAPPVSVYAQAITDKMVDKCWELKLAAPQLIVEPGRAIVGQAGVALYTVGVVKDIPGVRCYVSVDGGMADNIRPALYGAKYEAVVANKMRQKEDGAVTISGKFCESGDVLVRDIALPSISTGDIIAIPDCGAYCLPMGSNYNASLKPAVVLVSEGKAQLIRRRETLADLTRCDLV